MDRPTIVTGPDTSADPAGERTRYQYDVAGRLTQVTLPLTPDLFLGALANLSLSLDPLTQNRFVLAGGNPLSFREWDGHQLVEDGGGGAATDPIATNPIRVIVRPTSTTSHDDGGDRWRELRDKGCQNCHSACTFSALPAAAGVG